MIPPDAWEPSAPRESEWASIVRHWRLAVLDLRRLYGIDLTEPAVMAGPWARVRPYLLGLLVERDSLVFRATWR